ncbi:MAG: glycoside hydrolase family 13 protein [Actinobacteria bacterium]|nr:glycoside hydrolase family 13 protein [Actinomycetota bacterium]MBI3688071.1 glycoside hydrolase family 13 protein [Actinomycetota bacterium]
MRPTWGESVVHRVTEGTAGQQRLAGGTPWWRNAVFYQVYVRSFADANTDGVGDLRGVRDRLGYLSLLGIDALWLTPFYRSPMADHGYDVADPRDVDPIFGNLDDLDELIRAAHQEGLRVTIDLIPNHTSDRHPWFMAAGSAPPGSAERERYFFRPGRGPDGAMPPNNWLSVFGGPAWSRLPDGEWYLHLFAPQQPDLNWSHPDVVADFEQTMQFWLDRGVDGFRLDVAHGMAKPADLPDMAEPQAPGVLKHADHEADPRFDNDGVHDLHRMIRRVADKYADRVLTGEAWVVDDDRLARYVRPDELHLAFNFRLLEADWNAEMFVEAITHSLNAMSSVDAPPTWVLSNHDMDRHVTRYGGGELGTRRARAAALVQLALPGVAYVYNGDELGLPNVELPDEALQDPVWERSDHADRGRDGERVPLPWNGAEPPYGFTEGPGTWLPMPADWGGLAVEAQLDDPDSMLSLYRNALEIRREHPAMSGDEVQWFGAPTGCLAFRRTGGLVCALNAADELVPMPPGEVVLSSGPLEDGMLPPDTAAWLV